MERVSSTAACSKAKRCFSVSTASRRDVWLILAVLTGELPFSDEVVGWQRRVELHLLLPVSMVFQHTHPAMKIMVDPQVAAWGEANKPRVAQQKFHVKKNDEVVVLSGTQQGKRGKVLQVLRDRNRVIIEGVNFIKKASRKSQEQPQGGIIEREGALHISKIMLAADYDSRKGAKPAAADTRIQH